MTFAKFSRAFKLSIALAAILPAAHAGAQDSGYVPPPMFEDMTPPMVRPEPKADGMIVEPKVSPNTVLPDSNQPRPAMVAPRISVDPNSAVAAPSVAPVAPQVPVAPVTPSVPSAAVPAPAAPIPPKMMQPIVEETYIKREKPAEKVEKKQEAPKKPVAPVVPPKKPAAPVGNNPDSTTIKPAVDAVPPVPKTEVVPATPAVEAHVPRPPSADIPAPVVTPVTPPAAPAVPVAPPMPEAKAPVKAVTDDRTQPVKRDPKESAIKGPKVMPSLPVQGVEGEVTYEGVPNSAAATETILERHQKAATETEAKKDALPIVPAPKAGVTPATFDKGEQDALKKSIVYAPGQVGLVAADADPIAAGVSLELDKPENKAWRVQIRSYATPHGTGISSDRRIALSRALSLRTELIRQGVAASRIDVLAEGLQTEPNKPGDRVDLYLYGPKKD